MEGTDLSIFDHVGEKDNRDQEDEDALGQLEWELASQSGRVTGNILYCFSTYILRFSTNNLCFNKGQHLKVLAMGRLWPSG